MSDPLLSSFAVAASGLDAQSQRMKVVSENLANANSTANAPGGDPYQRKTISFAAELDRASASSFVNVSGIDTDKSEFPLQLDPGNIAANEDGFVKMPNVNMLVEMADMREASRSYEANLNVMRQVRELVSLTIDMMSNR